MAGTRLIRRRIRSIQSTAKITEAMGMIATAKMRRAQERVLAGRPYAEKMHQVLADLTGELQAQQVVHPLLQKRPVAKIAVVSITADRGLCGGLNANMNRTTTAFLMEQSAADILITIGRKGRDFMLRYGREIRADFTGLGDRPTLLDILPVCRVVIDDYVNGIVDQVYVAYTRFVTTLTQRPVIEQLLPVEPARREQPNEIEYIYEPSSQFVLGELLPRFVETQVYHALLESIASEQSARMVAMRNASENANEIIQDLTLMYNKARQEMITKELLEIMGGAEALD